MLPLFETALNMSVSVATGFTPRQLLFVFPARMPLDHAFEEGESEDGVGVDRGVPSERWARQFSEGIERVYR